MKKNEKTTLKIGGCDLLIGENVLEKLPGILTKQVPSFDYVFVLTDSGSKRHVVPYLKKKIPQLKGKNIITIKSGEHNKQLATCEFVWNKLTLLKADRYSLLINIGGGAVCDLGGFVASTYMRGIKYINIPTTLLAMVDASVGGKVGVDFNGLKNHIGLFSAPKAVFVSPVFLLTLSKRLMLCGYAEMLKHALIVDGKYWNKLTRIPMADNNWHPLIKRSVEIKKEITENDPDEKAERKLLNFGHTAGHALEAYCIKIGYNNILHGEAVAWGMIVEACLSHICGKLLLIELEEITSTIRGYYKLKLPDFKVSTLINIMRSDKKNKMNHINFTLLTKIGEGRVDNYCEDNLIEEAILYANEQF